MVPLVLTPADTPAVDLVKQGLSCRPELAESIQSLALVRREYLNPIVDHNIAQFQLWWATGWFSEPAAVPRSEA